MVKLPRDSTPATLVCGAKGGCGWILAKKHRTTSLRIDKRRVSRGHMSIAAEYNLVFGWHRIRNGIVNIPGVN